MYRRVYTSIYHCPLCNKDSALDVLSQDLHGSIDQHGEDFALVANMQYHADAEHTICGICGELIKGEDFELIIGDTYTGKVHSNYLNKHLSFNKNTDLLAVHKHCTGTKIIGALPAIPK